MNKVNSIIELTWPQLAKIIFDAQRITTGLWQIAVKLRFAGTNMQIAGDPSAPQDPTLAVPCSLTAIEGVLLFPVNAPGPMIFDAAQTLTPASKAAKATASKPRAVAKKAAVKGKGVKS